VSAGFLTRTSRRQEALQWFALGAAPLAWTTQHVLGFGVTQAACHTVGHRWSLDTDVWELAFFGAAIAVVVAAELAAIVLFLAIREVEPDDPPPAGRRHFFAAAALVGNVLFLAIILMTGLGSYFLPGCRQS